MCKTPGAEQGSKGVAPPPAALPLMCRLFLRVVGGLKGCCSACKQALVCRTLADWRRAVGRTVVTMVVCVLMAIGSLVAGCWAGKTVRAALFPLMWCSCLPAAVELGALTSR